MAKEKMGKPPETGAKSPFQKFQELAKKIVISPKKQIPHDGSKS